MSPYSLGCACVGLAARQIKAANMIGRFIVLAMQFSRGALNRAVVARAILKGATGLAAAPPSGGPSPVERYSADTKFRPIRWGLSDRPPPAGSGAGQSRGRGSLHGPPRGRSAKGWVLSLARSPPANPGARYRPQRAVAALPSPSARRRLDQHPPPAWATRLSQGIVCEAASPQYGACRFPP